MGKGLEDNGIPIQLAIKEAVILTQYASETRYPGPFEPVTEEECQEAVRLAEGVVRWAESIIRGKESKVDEV
ncbi:HEPN domain-containing protein [bacterium]|nr:HEPN domain-containing protein [bacterium]